MGLSCPSLGGSNGVFIASDPLAKSDQLLHPGEILILGQETYNQLPQFYYSGAQTCWMIRIIMCDSFFFHLFLLVGG